MSTQPTPKALRRADEYEAAHAKWALEDLYGTSNAYTAEKLAERHAARAALEKEMLRLHAENAQLREQNTTLDAACAKLEAVRGTPATGGEPVAWYEYNADLDLWFIAYTHNPKAKTRPLVFGDTSPQPVREPLSTIDLMRVVMKADEESQDTRGTTNWAAHIGKAVQNAVLGITGGQHGTE